MSLGDLTGPAAYVVILIGSALEGEVIYVSACALVGRDVLPAAPVIVAGMIGAAAGDHFYYLAARGWLGRVLRERQAGTRRREAILARVRKHGAVMAFAIRFLPGIRIAISIACAASDVPALRFSLANLAGAFVWAVSVMAFVAWGGPAFLAGLGLPDWMAWVIPAALVLAALFWISRTDPDSGTSV
jgi:membrane protein DedA with SNARE-associated domain